MTRNRRLTESGRVEAFSDAVSAITIILLVLEIHRPALDEPELGRRLLERWPDYGSFAVSFVYVGVVWLNRARTGPLPAAIWHTSPYQDKESPANDDFPESGACRDRTGDLRLAKPADSPTPPVTDNENRRD